MKKVFFTILRLVSIFFFVAARADLHKPDEGVAGTTIPVDAKGADNPKQTGNMIPLSLNSSDYCSIEDSITIDPHDTFDGTSATRPITVIEEIIRKVRSDLDSTSRLSPTKVFLYALQMAAQFLATRQWFRQMFMLNMGIPWLGLACTIVLLIGPMLFKGDEWYGSTYKNAQLCRQSTSALLYGALKVILDSDSLFARGMAFFWPLFWYVATLPKIPLADAALLPPMEMILPAIRQQDFMGPEAGA